MKTIEQEYDDLIPHIKSLLESITELNKRIYDEGTTLYDLGVSQEDRELLNSLHEQIGQVQIWQSSALYC